MAPKERILTKSTGESDTVGNWAIKTGLKKGTILQRLNSGKTEDEALIPLLRMKKGITLEVDGEELTIPEFSKKFKLDRGTVRRRHSGGWSVDQILGREPSPRLANSKTLIAKKLGISHQALSQRLQNGWLPEDALTKGKSQGVSVKPNAKKRGRKPKRNQ
jgi:hypothetical protein